jgi:ABC-2 type transport system ATP-binding protein
MSHRRRAGLFGTGAVLLLGASAALPAAPATAAGVTVSVTTLHFKTSYATTGGVRQCDVVGDLYVPSDASPSHREPAVLTTNGFGGSKADQAALALEMGKLGYVTLSYSGLGFGGSGCPITDDDPSSDGKVAQQLVSFLGGASGIGFSAFDPLSGWSGPTTTNVVRLDGPGDPRVGMVGGSYGGQIQFAAAGDDPRIDTIVPFITWHDLSYSLDPGNTNLPGDKLAPGLPGVTKVQWDNFFFGLGAAAYAGASTSGSPHPQPAGEPQPESETTFGPTDAMCPGFQPETCQAEAQANLTGTADATAQAFFTHSSVTSYLDRIHVPVFLNQGQHDTLFNLQEAAATYTALRERGIPVKMDWQSWGHSQIGAAPGEYPYSSDDATTTYAQTYQGRQVLAWFDHYLKGTAPQPPLDFQYFRDYAYTGSGTAGAANEPAAQRAYGESSSYPAGHLVRYDLSGTSALVPAGSPVTTGAASLTAVPQGKTSYSNLDAVGVVTSYSQPLTQPDPSDTAGTVASWKSAPLTTDTDVVGIPTLDVTVTSGEAQTTDPSTQLVLFAKLYDVAPDGTTLTLPARLISPLRVPGALAANTPKALRISLPGIVHRFAKGHALQVTLASGDAAYAGNMTPRTASFQTSAAHPGVLSLPVVSAAAVAPAPVAVPPRPAPAPPTTSLPRTGLPASLPLAGSGLVGLSLVVLRRRRTTA